MPSFVVSASSGKCLALDRSQHPILLVASDFLGPLAQEGGQEMALPCRAVVTVHLALTDLNCFLVIAVISVVSHHHA
jgi:hypothetical protein